MLALLEALGHKTLENFIWQKAMKKELSKLKVNQNEEHIKDYRRPGVHQLQPSSRKGR